MHDNEFKLCAVIAALGVTVALVNLAGCDKGQPVVATAVSVAEPPIVRELRASWEAGCADKTGKDAWASGQLAMRTALRKSVADGKLREIQEFVEACVKADDKNWIAYELQAEIVFELMSRPDKAELARVLAWGSTDHSSYWSIERSLTMPDMPWNRLPDGLDVLFDAFDLAKTAKAKEANYFAVWRALGDLPLKTTDQDQYMRVARSWYRENRARLVPLRGYDHTDFTWWLAGDKKGQQPRHLFSVSESSPR